MYPPEVLYTMNWSARRTNLVNPLVAPAQCQEHVIPYRCVLRVVVGTRVRLYPLDDDLVRRQLPLCRHPQKKTWINIQVLVGVPEHDDACSGCSGSHPNIDYVAQLRRRAVVIEHPEPFTRDSCSPRVVAASRTRSVTIRRLLTFPLNLLTRRRRTAAKTKIH